MLLDLVRTSSGGDLDPVRRLTCTGGSWMARLSRSSPTCPAARASLATFMDAVVIMDPVQYQRRRDERDDVSMPLRSLHFGPESAGLVTFLVYPPDDLVLVIGGTALRYQCR